MYSPLRSYDMSQNTTPLDNESAKLIRAAEAGNAKAQAHLGWYYDEGEGVEVDHKKPSTGMKRQPLKILPKHFTLWAYFMMREKVFRSMLTRRLSITVKVKKMAGQFLSNPRHSETHF